MSNGDDMLSSFRAMRRTKESAPSEANPPDAPDTPDAPRVAPHSAPAEPPPPEPAPVPQTGITPLELLNLSGDLRRLINWLSRRKQSTLPEVMAALNLDEPNALRLLDEARAARYIVEALINGELCYRVVFRGTVRRGSVGLPAEIWQRVDLDRVAFLRQIPLFSSLNDDQLRDVSGRMGEQRYQRDDVLLWQGTNAEHVFFIMTGIVGITRYTPQTKEPKLLNYLKSGDILGEYNVIAGPGTTATATATALSRVVALTLKRADFLALLNGHASVAIELARVLASRLISSGARTVSGNARLVTVVGARVGVGSTAVASALAMTLAKTTGRRVAFTELPDTRRLSELYALTPDTPAPAAPTLPQAAEPTAGQAYTHPSGYSVVLGGAPSMLPLPVRVTLLLDQLLAGYEYVVVGVAGGADEVVNYLSGQSDQIVLVTTPDAESWAQLGQIGVALRGLINPEKVGLFTVVNRIRADHAALPPGGRADFDLPHAALPNPRDVLSPADLPEPWARFAATLVDRLGRTNVVSLYIPTTVDVNTALDTGPFVEKTLAFLGQLFGGATTNQARGVWNSADAGLVSEDIHIVRSYATQADLDNHLQKILDYVEEMKRDLRQEAMAVEINQKLMLI